MRIALIAMSGVRAYNPELTALGLSLPGFVERGKTIASLPSLGLLTLAGTSFADDAPEKWYDRVDLLGDARLRYEGFRQDDNFNDDRRDRFRIRLRVGIEIAITDALKVGIQARNGDPDDPVSNNTSFDGAFQFKEFNLAQGYVDFRAASWLDVIGGKFEAGKRSYLLRTIGRFDDIESLSDSDAEAALKDSGQG